MSGTSIDFKVEYIKEKKWDVIAHCYETLRNNICKGFPDVNQTLVEQTLFDSLPLIKSLDLSNTHDDDRLIISYDYNTEGVSMSIIKHEKNQCH